MPSLAADAERLRQGFEQPDARLSVLLSNTIALFATFDAELRRLGVRDDYILVKSCSATAILQDLLLRTAQVDAAWEIAVYDLVSDCRECEAMESDVDPDTGYYR